MACRRRQLASKHESGERGLADKESRRHEARANGDLRKHGVWANGRPRKHGARASRELDEDEARLCGMPGRYKGWANTDSRRMRRMKGDSIQANAKRTEATIAPASRRTACNIESRSRLMRSTQEPISRRIAKGLRQLPPKNKRVRANRGHVGLPERGRVPLPEPILAVHLHWLHKINRLSNGSPVGARTRAFFGICGPTTP